jgi:aryl-alcohol dehydrogenase-like predicted oxidoreductase
MVVTTVPLGASEVRVTPLAFGTWAQGDSAFWGYGARHGPAEAVDVFTAALDGGVRFFDSAEVYGHGESERILGALARRAGVPLVLATKFAPLAGRGGAGAFPGALAGSLKRLGVRRVDLYLAHWADRAEVSIPALMDAFAGAVRRGFVRAVGVSNFTAAELREAHAALARHGVPLAAQQVRYSALDRGPERDGVLAACRELDVTLLAYSPLAQGVLAGAYTAEHPPPGPRAALPGFSPARLRAAAPLVALLRAIGAARGGRGPEQVALNWLRAKPGVIPVVGATSGEQARRCAASLEWSLTADEAARIDALAASLEEPSTPE